MAIFGINGESLYDHWRDGMRTLHGIMSHGFPNLFIAGGRFTKTLSPNYCAPIDVQVLNVVHVIQQLTERGIKSAQPSAEAEEAFVADQRASATAMTTRSGGSPETRTPGRGHGLEPAPGAGGHQRPGPDTGNIKLLHLFGTDEQKNRWLAPLLDRTIRSAFSMTEVAVASSDATRPTSSGTATRTSSAAASGGPVAPPTRGAACSSSWARPIRTRSVTVSSP